MSPPGSSKAGNHLGAGRDGGLAWVFLRTDADKAVRARGYLDRLATDDALVPELWRLELANALVVAERRAAISTARVHDFL